MVGKELNEEVAYHLGRLFSSNAVVIARDNRKSSLSLLNAFKQGLMDSGNHVIEIKNVASSPLLYFASIYLKTNFALMVTGSHNPLQYNGFKLMKNGKAFYGQELKAIVNNPIIDAKGSYEIIDCRKEYISALLKHINITRKLKIAWECNNSGASHILKQMNIAVECILLNDSTDGEFAHIPPDPLVKENIQQLQQIIMKEQCHFGFAFDGDGDRLVMVKPDGKVLTSDQLIYIVALSLKSNDNNLIIVDVKCSSILIEALKDLGFEVIISASGHSIIKARIIEENAILAAEASGHFIINDSKYYPVDDALYIALRIIEYLQNNQIIELPLAPIRIEYKIPINKKDKINISKKLQEYDENQKTLGGLRKDYSYGWWLIRVSNTEDHILIKYEAINEEMEQNIKQELLEFINMSLSLI